MQTYAARDGCRGGKKKAAKNHSSSIISGAIYRATARDKTLLQNLGITHVVNAADGPQHIDTGPRFYRDNNIKYHGVEAADCRDFDLSPYFSETADFINGALSQKGTIQSNYIRTEAWR